MKLETKGLKGKELAKYLTEKLDEIADNLSKDPVELQKFVKKWNSGFHTYSLNNTLLIWLQKPEAIENPLIAGYKAWKNQYGRQVCKGERAIRILAPRTKVMEEEDGEKTVCVLGYFPVSVFHVSQTTGDPIDDDLGCPDLISGDVDFETMVRACPFPVHIKDGLGFSNGNTDGKTINIAKKSNEASMCATLAHEWSHALMHFKEPVVLFETDVTSVKELEAETSSFVVCSALGIKNEKSRLYIANWGGNATEIRHRGKTILSTAESIIRKISIYL